MRVIKLQPASYIDGMTGGHELTKLPYPIFVSESGEVQCQNLWQGVLVRVVGFQRDLAVQRINLRWPAVWERPESVIGTYLVTENGGGGWQTHITAIIGAEVTEIAEELA
jgi:hypothetical protein